MSIQAGQFPPPSQVIEGLREMFTKPSDVKETNPKAAIGAHKIPFHLWPESASALGALGLLDGMLKYGRTNWRVSGVRATTYIDAARRHLSFYFEGENLDPDSGLPHLAHVLACVAIIIDADAAGVLHDDRQVAGGFREWATKLTPYVAMLLKKHEGKSPKHYTIADNKPAEKVGAIVMCDCTYRDQGSHKFDCPLYRPGRVTP